MAVTQRVGTRHCEAFYQIFVQALGSPAAELGAAMGFDPVTDGDNSFKIIVLGTRYCLPSTAVSLSSRAAWECRMGRATSCTCKADISKH
jgi:hypothetical protein